MATKLFVGNLSFDTTEEAVRDLFSSVGEVVDVFLPTDRMTGRQRGFAFVTYGAEADANTAMETLDGHELDGRALRVNEAQQRSNESRGFGGGGGYGGPPPGGPPAGRRKKGGGSRRGLRGKKRSL